MHNKSGNQTIHCSVKSCRYYDQKGLCDLDGIQVRPSQGCGTGVASEETLCGSYKTGATG
ncbi:MAG: DUF1540 domain-containing protein [Christensenellales bacterium]|jgi:hypothetical protein